MAKLYVGNLNDRTREGELKDLFSQYGKIRSIETKAGYAFIGFESKRDAEEARKALDNYDLNGSNIIVQYSHESQPGGKRRPVPGEGRCFRCGQEGHWARECPSGGSESGGRAGGSYNSGGNGGGRYNGNGGGYGGHSSRTDYRRSPSPGGYGRRRSPSPRRRLSPSPIRRGRSRSPPGYSSRGGNGGGYVRRSPSPFRRSERRSPSPRGGYGRRRTPSPYRRMESRPRARTPSPVRGYGNRPSGFPPRARSPIRTRSPPRNRSPPRRGW